MVTYANYSSLLATPVSLSSDLLTSWYAARAAQTTATVASAGSSSSQSASSFTSTSTTELPPWDPRSSPPTTDQRLLSAMNGSPFIDPSAAKLTSANPTDIDHQLFALYNGISKLSALANNAADKSTPELMLTSLNNRFQSGLDQIIAYAQKIQSSTVSVVAGQQGLSFTTKVATPNDYSIYTTGIMSRVATNLPMPGLNGTEDFTISVTKGGATTNVDINLADMGTPNITLDDLISFMNQKLQAAGMVSRFSKVRLNTTNADGTEISPPPQTWGLQIQGTPSENLSFSAASAGPAVYLVGNAGKPGETAGQMIKLDATSGSTPSVLVSNRIEAAGSDTSTTTTNTSTASSSTVDPTDANSVIANIKALTSSVIASTSQDPNAPQTQASASAMDADGNLYVVGSTEGSLNGEIVQGSQDVYLTKYNSTGQVVWQRMLGAEGTTTGVAVAVDSSGNVVIVGKTTAHLNGGAGSNTSTNSFVTKYDKTGQEQFTRDVGPVAADSATSVVIGSDGSIYVGGQTGSAIAAGATYGGGTDGTITKLSATGSLVYNREFGGSGNETVTSLATDPSGNLVAVSMESGHAIVSKYDPADGTSAAIWQQDLGDLGGGQASSVAIDGNNIYVGGWTSASGIGGGSVQNSYQGGTDGFVVGLDTSGAINTTSYIGTAGTDRIRTVTAKNGEVFVAGDTTGSIGATFSGVVNGFAGKLNASGALDWAYQYNGRDGQARVNSIQVDEQGTSVLDVLGLPKGTLSYSQSRTVIAQSTVRPGQSFYITVNGGAKRRIEIDANDTLMDLSFKINRVLVLDGKASVVHNASGASSLKIASSKGVRIDLSAGPAGEDALKGLGLPEGTIVNTIGSASSSSSSSDSGSNQPIYAALGLSSDLQIATRTDAGNVSKILLDAAAAVSKAYRTLHTPKLAGSGNTSASGPVPAYLSAQLANYQAGLQRLTAGGTSTSTISSLI